MHTLWLLLIGGIIGALAASLTSKNLPMGWVGNILAGLLGSWLGEQFLGTWGPSAAGLSLFPSIIVAVILVLITSLVFKSMNNNQ